MVGNHKCNGVLVYNRICKLKVFEAFSGSGMPCSSLNFFVKICGFIKVNNVDMSNVLYSFLNLYHREPRVFYKNVGHLRVIRCLNLGLYKSGDGFLLDHI